MDTTPRDLDALLAQAGWAKALARSLVRDPDRADDLVQRAWLAALRNPPDEAIPPRRWLAAVMRNFVRDDARESASRAERERQVARPERTPGADPFDDAASAQARLLAAVRELPEPNRSAVWARYYEGLAPREIAARDGVPVDTVKTRIARGLDALRKRFDREHGGDRGAWVVAFLPLTAGTNFAPPTGAISAPGHPLAAPTLTTLVMDAKLKIAAVLAVVACGTAVWISTRDGEVSPGANAYAAPLATEEARPSERLDPAKPTEPASESRVVAAAPAVAETAPAAVVAEPRDGIVMDLERRPVAGLEIVEEVGRKPILFDGRGVISDARGRFQIPADKFGFVAARGPGWTTAFAMQGDLNDKKAELRIVVAHERSLSGTVVDSKGAPVAGALVVHNVAEPVRRAFGELLRGPISIVFEERTDEQGRFSFESAPDADALLTASAQNQRSGSKAVPPGPVVDVVIALPAPESNSIVLRGRVLDADGAGVVGATVGLADESVQCLADGRFELPVPRSTLEGWQRRSLDGRPPVGPTPLVLRALAENRLPARTVLPELAELERVAPTEEFVLHLGGKPLAIFGRVIDAAGEPVSGAAVTIVGEEEFGVIEMNFSGMSMRGQLSIEQFLRGGFAAQPIVSDAAGRFTIPGLQDRDYVLDVVASAIPSARRTNPIRAGGHEVDIALDTSGARTRPAGRVVDRRGEPIGGVRVTVHSVVSDDGKFVEGPLATADAEGRFAFAAVRGREFRFELSGEEVVRTRVDVRAGEKLDELVLPASRRAFVQVDVGGRADYAADRTRFLDASGKAVRCDVIRTSVSGSNTSSISWSSETLSLTDGRSEVGSMAEGDYTCVLEKDGAEVARIPVSLGGKGVTIVRP